MWINGPKRELPPQFVPANAVTLNTRRQYAEANRELMRDMTSVFADLAQAVEQRPAEVKAAITVLFPTADARTVDRLFITESLGFKAKPLTAADMAHEIRFLKATGIPLPQFDKLDPASMIFP